MQKEEKEMTLAEKKEKRKRIIFIIALQTGLPIGKEVNSIGHWPYCEGSAT